MAKLVVKPLEEVLRNDYLEIEKLLTVWVLRAKEEGNETAVNAVVKLTQMKEQIAKEYQNIVPGVETNLDKFRKQNEARRKKNTSKRKT